MCIAANQDLILAGVNQSFSPNFDMYVVRANSNGDTVWTRSLGWANAAEYAHGVVEDWAGNIVVAGWGMQHSYPYVSWAAEAYKLSPTGDSLWFEAFGDLEGDDYAFDIEIDYGPGID
jgi:hypothetical protein